MKIHDKLLQLSKKIKQPDRKMGKDCDQRAHRKESLKVVGNVHTEAMRPLLHLSDWQKQVHLGTDDVSRDMVTRAQRNIADGM